MREWLDDYFRTKRLAQKDTTITLTVKEQDEIVDKAGLTINDIIKEMQPKVQQKTSEPVPTNTLLSRTERESIRCTCTYLGKWFTVIGTPENCVIACPHCGRVRLVKAG